MTYIEEDAAGARDRILAIAGPEFDGVDPTWRGFLAPSLVRCLAATGEIAEAERRAHEAVVHAARFDLRLGVPRAHAALAEVELARGEYRGAAARALEAAAAAGDRGGRRDAIVALLVAGRAQSADGDRDSAVATLRGAAERSEEVGFAHLRGIAARELRALGSGSVPPRHGRSTAASSRSPIASARSPRSSPKAARTKRSAPCSTSHRRPSSTTSAGSMPSSASAHEPSWPQCAPRLSPSSRATELETVAAGQRSAWRLAG